MPLPKPQPPEDLEYVSDIMTGRRVELRVGDDCLIALQYFPEFNNVSWSFYTKDMPGFTFGIATEDWQRVQEMVAAFTWRGRRQ